ncbi:hypothetical protein Y032_0019g3953 [Ancylostoma ceylanicum]|uniref:Uncharacterized protein n=1 Tax=Ancylostoma ceylanicum TaxID=53326 RepID=A0A016V337_9BILA|nr:hypothetical protein Y032_0019g3953 [Ancylostoma ceylanicum]
MILHHRPAFTVPFDQYPGQGGRIATIPREPYLSKAGRKYLVRKVKMFGVILAVLTLILIVSGYYSFLRM